jgi:plastocyanin
MRELRLLGLVVAVVASCAQRSTSAADGPTIFPDAGALFGAHVGLRNGLDRRAAWTQFEDMVGQPMAMDRQYYMWNDAWPTADDAWSRDQGRTLFLSWNARRADGTYTSWARIADGSEDAMLDARAADLIAFGAPVVFAFHHEPEGDSGAGTGTDYRAAFRHIRERFSANSVTNVAYAWVLSASSFATSKATSFYPGDDVVDVVGADGYNWFACPNRPGSPWKAFAGVFTAFHTFGAAHAKPMVIAEWGSNEDPNRPGRKAQWIAEAATQIKRWTDVKAVVYYHQNRGCPRWVDSSASSLDSFRGAVSDPYFVPPPSVAITSGPQAMTTTTSANLAFTSGPDPAGYRCRIDGGTTGACNTGAMSYTDLGGVPHRFEVWGVDSTGTAVTGVARWAWTAALPNDVLASDSSFSPATRYMDFGGPIIFTNSGTSTHTATSSVKMFDTGTIAPGRAASIAIPGAGIYSYSCSIHTSVTGTVRSVMKASPMSATVTTPITLTWAPATAPAGRVFDVQMQRPGSTTWRSVLADTTSSSTSFVAGSGAGTYKFRARTQRTDTGATTAWSGTVSVSITS